MSTRVSIAVASTAPQSGPVSASLDNNITAALVTTVSTMAATGIAAAAVKAGAGIVETTSGKVVSVGKLALSPKQMESAGVLKFGSAVLINSLVQGGATVKEAMTSNLFTGKQGAENLQAFIKNQSAQVDAFVINLRQSQTALTNARLITGLEDATQIAGLILSGAIVGIPATLDFVKTSKATL